MEKNFLNTIEKNRKQIWDLHNSLDICKNISNSNILLNGNFKINQRGFGTYQGNATKMTYTVDRWCLYFSPTNFLSYTWDKTTVLCTSTEDQICFGQIIDIFSIYKDKNLTFTLKYNDLKNGGIQLVIYNGSHYVFSDTYSSSSGTISLSTYFSSDCTSLSVWIKKIGASTSWQCCPLEAKLEVGKTSTPFAPTLYEEELRKCKYYYQKLDVLKTRVFREDVNTLYADVPVIMRRTPEILSYTNWYIRIYLPDLVDAWCWQNTIIEPLVQYSNSLTLKLTCVNHGIGDGHLFMENLALDGEIY